MGRQVRPEGRNRGSEFFLRQSDKLRLGEVVVGDGKRNACAGSEHFIAAPSKMALGSRLR